MDEEDWDADIGVGSTATTFKPTTNVTNTTTSSYYNNQSSSSSSFGRGRLVNSLQEKRFASPPAYKRDFSPFKQRDSGEKFDTNNNSYSGSYSTLTESLNIETRSIASLIGKAGATISNIREKCSVKIIIPPREELQNQSNTDIKIIGSSKENIDKAKEMIRETIGQKSSFSSTFNRGGGNNDYRDGSSNKIESFKRPFSSGDSFENRERKQSFNAMSSDNSDKNNSSINTSGINWDLVRSQPLQSMEKFKDHPPVIKNFYEEDTAIKAMTRDEVKEFRKANFNIMVELFKKENLSYSSTKKVEEDTRTPEEIEDYLFSVIPNPVKKIEQAFSRYPEILEECKRQNFVDPTPIQSQLWPILLKGLDCVGIAQTGTGKTLAFLLPALIHIDNQITPRDKRCGPNCLVLSPTRELAIQIEQEVKKINYKGIKSVCVYGGGDRKEQANVCTRGVEIIIATPGRLYDLIQAKIVNVTSVTYLVLDEADRMLDLGFEPQIMKILLDIRPDRQTVMTSATWPEGVRRLATKYLNEPIQLYVGSLDLTAAKSVTQYLEMVRSDDEKRDILMNYIEKEMDENDKLIVFVGRKALADNLSCDLILKNIACQSIHGDREQCDREEALEDFKEGKVRILIATDVASRGIDVKDITCVLNYDFPRNIEEYVHRVGRTGRAGRLGKSITLMAREDWKHAKDLIEILGKGQQEIPNSLLEMAERYEAMLLKRKEEGGSGGGYRRGGGSGGFGGDRGCFKCGEKGHMSRECTNGGGGSGGGGGNDRGGFGGDRGCYKCGEMGHMSRECTNGSSGNAGRSHFGGSGSNGGDRAFIPRGRRGGRGGRNDDSGGFVLY